MIFLLMLSLGLFGVDPNTPQTDFLYAHALDPRCTHNNYVYVYCDGVKMDHVFEASVIDGWVKELVVDENGAPVMGEDGCSQVVTHRGHIQILFASPKHKEDYLKATGRLILA